MSRIARIIRIARIARITKITRIARIARITRITRTTRIAYSHMATPGRLYDSTVGAWINHFLLCFVLPACPGKTSVWTESEP